ncbi:ABC transporter permease [Lysinibacillus endophyticus]|uniref:ABC transporter permease n=1 Tax=Ureibacillus endophyticus TaxID=1978490 RepID=UPI00313591B3
MSKEIKELLELETAEKQRVRPTFQSTFKGKVWDFITGSYIPILILIVWQLVGQFNVVSPIFLPTPTSILQSFWDLLVANKLTEHLAVSIGRACLGFVIGGALGLVFGGIVGLSRYLEYLLNPSFQLLRMTPTLAIAPLIILWFGFGEVSKVVIIAIAAFFPLYLQTFMGIRAVDHKLFEVTKVLGFNKMKLLYHLIIPSAMPNILLGVRLSLGVSWLSLVVAELLGSQSGVGFLINLGKQNAVTEYIFVGIIIFAVFGKFVDSIVRIIEKKKLNWRDNFKG